MSKPLNKKMGDKHEEYVAEQIGARKTRGSGNQWRDQTDGKHNHRETAFAFAFDGKSTLGKGVNVTRVMWDKAKEQAGAERPMLALRYYEDETLEEFTDLVVLSLDDFVEMREAALPQEGEAEPEEETKVEPEVLTQKDIRNNLTRTRVDVRKFGNSAKVYVDGVHTENAEVRVDRSTGPVAISLNNRKLTSADLYVDNKLVASSGYDILNQKVYNNGEQE